MAVPVSATAEEYWNFGLLGVILMSALYGALIRYTHNFYLRRSDRPFVVATFVIFVTTFRLSTDDLVLFQQQILLLAFVCFLALVFARSGRRATPNGQSILHHPDPETARSDPPGRAVSFRPA
jgi:O-antigen ligase